MNINRSLFFLRIAKHSIWRRRRKLEDYVAKAKYRETRLGDYSLKERLIKRKFWDIGSCFAWAKSLN